MSHVFCHTHLLLTMCFNWRAAPRLGRRHVMGSWAMSVKERAVPAKPAVYRIELGLHNMLAAA